MPVVGHFYQGMIVTVPLVVRMLARKVTPGDVSEVLGEYYEREPFIRVFPANAEVELEAGFLSPLACNGTNRMDIFVFGYDEQILVATRFDNLGKGASGTAVQSMNIMLGLGDGRPALVSPMTFDALKARWSWTPLHNCPGRYKLVNVRPDLPGEVLGADADLSEHTVKTAPDRVIVVRIDRGGLISYKRPDGTYLHTLNDPDGFARKLHELGIGLP